MESSEELIEAFLAHKELVQGRTPGTIRAYGLRLRRLAAFLAARGIPFTAATLEDLQAFAGVHLHQLGVTPRSRGVSVAAIREFYRFLHGRRLVGANPATHLEPPRVGTSLPYAMGRAHVEALFQTCDLGTFLGVRDAAIIAMLAGCGFRVSGLVSLNEESLEVEVERDGREIIFARVLEKGKHERIVPVPASAWLLLRAYLGHPELDRIDRTLPSGRRVLFVSTRNRSVPEHDYYGEARRLRTGAVREMLVKRGEEAGIPREYLHPHAMRHLFGVELAEGDVDLDLRAALLGHRRSDTTRLYDRMSRRRLRDAVLKAGPLASIRTPVDGLVEELRRRHTESLAR
ncbi:tyrosine-type recombinase/integrase [Thioalbus denitrificans]|uniref:Integrase/recombinase XerC/integrase/recombinase XerD n=1 Tax=Thioalbus denitrificans TaxID=547122 RepID=A0A369CEP8_9GAMM|nr:tyrosine-type recombinase/integrase [Thioalbus denitrificans]RCX31708.1 integrase/recombinase XerC/integrase/recombinase XerD [Thioalbus denitrificans]